MGNLYQGRRNSDRCTKHNISFFCDVGCLNNSYIYISQKTVTYILTYLRKMHVIILYFSCIDSITHFFIRLKRSTKSYGMCLCQCRINLTSGSSSGYKSNFKLFTFTV